ncbi:MAG: TIGR01244 family phosphatase [Alphaproteobacteria bacterium]|nr:MAG: TIGR01244 family phosphatase [Alphaproteobacteria bacterium]
MQLRKMSETVFVGGQILPGDVPELKAHGFRSIICNRPDGEEFGQPAFADIAAAAQAAGLEARCIPVRSGVIRPDDAASFAQALRELPGPVLAYCRSGARSASLWALSQAGRLAAE